MFSQVLLRRYVMVALIMAVALPGLAYARQRSGDEKGESPKSRALKNRTTTPRQSDVDKDVTLEALLSRRSEADWHNSKAAAVEGYVIQVEKEEDGDFHLALAADQQEHDTNKWVIVEVTPAWRKRNAALSDARLRQLHQKKVRVTGWLFFEPETEQADPRGTRWELHPVTNITVIKR
jgi:hypothetical protein